MAGFGHRARHRGGHRRSSRTGSPTSVALRDEPGPAGRPDRATRRLHNLVEGLCIAGGLPKPRVYVIDDAAPNAFATGRDPKHAAIAVTTGLLEKMNRVELEGVLAHELSHIKNYDILVSTLAVTMVGVIALAADFAHPLPVVGRRPRRNDNDRDGGGPTAILAIFGFALLILVAAHRPGHAARGQPPARDAGRRLRRRADPLPTRADLRAREAAGRPDGRPLHVARHRPPLDRAAHRPQRRRRAACRRINRLFDTHPPLEERIAALREL